MDHTQMATMMEIEDPGIFEKAKQLDLNSSSKSKITFWDALPDRGIIRDYFNFASPLTDAPEHFHLIVAMSLLGTCLGNNVFLKFGHQEIYPNIWAIILAPSSLFRKSTVISLGERVLRIFRKELIYPNEFTKEYLLKFMQKNPNGVFCWKEFASVLKYFEASYMSGTKEWFTEIYDCPKEYRREINQGLIKIEKPTVSILTASSLSWFNDKIKESDLHGGFYARFVYVPATKRTRETMPIPPPENGELLFNLKKKLESLQKIKGTVRTNKIENLYGDWLRGHEREIENHPQGEILSSFYTRLSIYTLKFALIYDLSMVDDPNSYNMEISPTSLQYAINLIELLKKYLAYLFEFEITPGGWYAKKKQKFIKLLNRHNGKMNKRTLQQYCNESARDFKTIIESMNEEETILIDEESNEVMLVKKYQRW